MLSLLSDRVEGFLQVGGLPLPSPPVDSDGGGSTQCVAIGHLMGKLRCRLAELI